MLWLFLTQAHAFCGSYVGPAGDVPTNGSSRIVVAYDGVDTTVTMTADARNAPPQFGMLIPVPAGTTEDDVRILTNHTDLDELDIYTSPRLVAYECSTLYSSTGAMGSGGCNTANNAEASGCNGAWDDAVDYAVQEGLEALEAEIPGLEELGLLTSGHLEFAILGADGGTALQAWLGAHDYDTAPGADAEIDNYLDQGVHLLAVEVTVPPNSGEVWLDPIQVVYPGEKVQALPLRLGAHNAFGDQEVTVWTISPNSDGAAQIVTFDESDQEQECMPAPGVDVTDTMEAAYSDAIGDRKGGWVTEYSWDLGQKCDPCPEGMTEPGPWVQNLGGPSAAHVTRMRMRFDPGQLDGELQWQYTGDDTARQLRYIQHADELEADFPICLEGWADPPAGTCDEERTESTTTSAGLPTSGLLMLPLLGWLARRKER